MALLLLVAAFALGAAVAYLLFRRDPMDFGEYRRTVPIPAPYNDVPADVEHEDKFIVNREGMVLYTRRFTPASGEIKAVVGLCHGFGDHTSWFVRNNAIKLVRRGFAVICMDSRGHGKSDGLHAHVPDFDKLVVDWRNFFTEQMKTERFKAKKLFIVGASMGGAVAIQVARKFGAELPLGGCVLCAPMCKIADALKPPQAVIDLARAIAPLFPEAPITPSNNVVQSAFKNPTILAEVMRNPLGYRKKPRLGTALEMLRVTAEIEKCLDSFDAPFLVMHGTNDLVTDAEISKELYNRSCSKDKSIRLYEGAWHALLEEDEDGKIMGDLTSWIDQRV